VFSPRRDAPYTVQCPKSETNEECKQVLQRLRLWFSTVTHVYRFEDSLSTSRQRWEKLVLPALPVRESLCFAVNFQSIKQWTETFEAAAGDPYMCFPSSSKAVEGAWSLKSRIQDLSGGLELYEDEELYAGLVLLFISAAYGGIHATLWSSHFPSSTESLIWKCSAVVVGAGIILPLIVILWLYTDPEEHSGTRKVWYVISLIATAFVAVFVVAFCVCYVAARLFLVIEAFISLRSLLPAVYETPNWTQWLPHL